MISLLGVPSIDSTANGDLMERKQKVHDSLRSKVRQKEGHEKTLRSAIIDSLRYKTTENRGERGYDAGKKVLVRKRHIIVENRSLLLVVVVHSASIQERSGAKSLMDRLATEYFPRLTLIWADCEDEGELVSWVSQVWGWVKGNRQTSKQKQRFHLVTETKGGGTNFRMVGALSLQS